MALPEFTMRQLMEAGVHFGHRIHLWNPKMAQYIYGSRNKIHIIDLGQTAPLLHRALKEISDTVAKGGRVLMVGTKRQAQEGIATAARESAQYFINARWLGGMLTNWQTVSQAIQRLRDLDEILATDTAGYTKKEMLNITRERDKLERNLGGIKDMGGIPDMLFVIDTNKESIAIKEAAKLKIPVAAVLDSNSSTDGVSFPIPGNDDAARSISLYCDLVSRAAIDGIERAQSELTTEGDDTGDDAGPRRSRQRRQGKQRKIEISDGKVTSTADKDANAKADTAADEDKKSTPKSEPKAKKAGSKTNKTSAKKTTEPKKKTATEGDTKTESESKPKSSTSAKSKTETKPKTKPVASKTTKKPAAKTKATTTKTATTATAKSKATAKTATKPAVKKAAAPKSTATAKKETKSTAGAKTKAKTAASTKKASS